MTTERRFMWRSMASVIDQALLSGLNFLIGIALIRYASKETYGLYAQLFGIGILATTLLEALIGSALTTRCAALEPEPRAALLARAARLQWLAASLMAVLLGTGAGVLSALAGQPESPVAIGCSFAAFLLALGAREYCRTALFTQSLAERVMRLDGVFVVLSLLAAAAYAMRQQVTVAGVMGLLALSNGLTALFYSRELLQRARGTAWAIYRDDMRSLWTLSRWALAGSMVGWVGNNAYLYFSSMLMGVTAAADLNAARILLIPVALLGVAWSRVARPTAGGLISAKDFAGLRRFSTRSSVVLVAVTLVYALALYLAFPWLLAHVLGEKYHNVALLLVLWGLYFAVNGARTVGTTVLTSYGAFKSLAWQGASSVLLLVVACLVLMPVYGVFGALAAMVLVECCELLVNWFYLLPRAQRQRLVLE